MLALVSHLIAPQPIHLEKWYSYADYPSARYGAAETAFETFTQTLVSASGKIVGCRAETASTDPQIDARACAIILKRGSFQPARWSDGTAVPGIYRTVVAFRQEGDDLPPHGDIELEVAQLPLGDSSPIYVTVAFASEPDGRIVDCAEQPSSTTPKKHPAPQLVAIACRTVANEWKAFTVLGDDGKPSRSVQNVTVMFALPSKR